MQNLPEFRFCEAKLQKKFHSTQLLTELDHRKDEVRGTGGERQDRGGWGNEETSVERQTGQKAYWKIFTLSAFHSL